MKDHAIDSSGLPKRRRDLQARISELREASSSPEIAARDPWSRMSAVELPQRESIHHDAHEVAAPRAPTGRADRLGEGRSSAANRLRRQTHKLRKNVRNLSASCDRHGTSDERNPEPTHFDVNEWIDLKTAPEDHFCRHFRESLETIELSSKTLYLDLETTGLGSHEIVALAGTVRPENAGVRLRQSFAFDPAQERRVLRSVLEEVKSADRLVTYNGRTFDVPFLVRRARWHGLPDPKSRLESGDLVHVDLLIEVRRRFRRHWPSCSLGTAEERLLHKRRTGPDVPGREVPLRFADVRDGAPGDLLKPVTHHNRIDLTSLVALEWTLSAEKLLETRSSELGDQLPNPPASL